MNNICVKCHVGTYDFIWETRMRKCRICGYTRPDKEEEDNDETQDKG